MSDTDFECFIQRILWFLYFGERYLLYGKPISRACRYWIHGYLIVLKIAEPAKSNKFYNIVFLCVPKLDPHLKN